MRWSQARTRADDSFSRSACEPPRPYALASSVLGMLLLIATAAQAAPIGEAAMDAGRPSFDPAIVRLDSGAPEARMIAALRAGDTAKARAIGHEALRAMGTHGTLRETDGLRRGRIVWLLARAGDEPTRRYRALHASRHPLARWAGLHLAERLQASDPTTAARIARSLSRSWAGAPRAAKLYAKLASTAHRLDSEPAMSTPASGTPSDASPAPADSANAELARAKQLVVARNYEQATRVLGALAAKTQADPQLSCQVGLEQGRLLAYQKERALCAEHMLQLAGRCQDLEIKTWARYYAGQSLLRSGDPQGALEPLRALVREAPASSLADDALQMQSVAYADLGRDHEQFAALEQLVASYPRGDMRADASFRLAALARQRGDLAAALMHLDALHSSGLDDLVEGQEGRAAYWHARTLQDMGDRPRAIEAYATIVQRYLVSYYAQHALARLHALDEARAQALRDALVQAARSEPLTFPYRAELDEAAFSSALELLRVGEEQLALSELHTLHAQSVRGSSDDARDPALMWISVALLAEAGAHETATRMARPLVRELLRDPSVAGSTSRAHALLRIAYPRAYDGLLEDAARAADIDAALLRAVAREESSFDPTAASPARAYGLTQVLVPTARIYAKPLGLPSHPEALKRPEINLRLGALFMRDVLRRYRDFTPLMPAAYNAGQGATERFLSENTEPALDAWVEAIPYPETRRYTRRVLQSYAFYRWLDQGLVTALPLEIPHALRPASPSRLVTAPPAG